MPIPDRPIRKTLRDPSAAREWLTNHIRDGIYKPLDAMLSPFTTNIFDRSWDVAVILDACRYDMAARSDRGRSMFGSPSGVWSVAANSKMWARRTFGAIPPDVRANTAYISANPYTVEIDRESLAHCEEVWRTGFDDTLGTIPPRPVTNMAIVHYRNAHPDRLLIHYMQPHLPSIIESQSRSGGKLEPENQTWANDNVWRRAKRNEVDRDRVIEAYRSNLDPILEELELLLSNIDAEKVVITADHGNALGRFGRWGHYRPYDVWPDVRRVPWWETDATDERTHDPDEELSADQLPDGNVSRTEQLRALGYKE